MKRRGIRSVMVLSLPLGADVGHAIGARLEPGRVISGALYNSLSGVQLLALRACLASRGYVLRGLMVTRYGYA